MGSMKRFGSFSEAGKCLQIVEFGVGALIALQELDMCLQARDGISHGFHIFEGFPPGDLHPNTHISTYLFYTNETAHSYLRFTLK